MQTFSREKDEKDHLDDDNCSTCQGCRNGPTKVPDGDARTGVRDVVAAEFVEELLEGVGAAGLGKAAGELAKDPAEQLLGVHVALVGPLGSALQAKHR